LSFGKPNPLLFFRGKKPMKLKSVPLSNLVLFVLLFSFPALAGAQSVSRNLAWTAAVNADIPGIKMQKALHFDGASYDENNDPYFFERLPLTGNPATVEVSLLNPVYEELREKEYLHATGKLASDPFVSATVNIKRKKAFASVTVVPFRKNPVTGNVERLMSFNLQVTPSGMARTQGIRVYADNSVLASGRWYKVSIARNGIYKLDYSFLQSIGVDLSSVDPRNIRVYGNGGAMLAYANATPRYDDLRENAIFVSGEGDGVFNSGDYVLFYGTGPTTWKYNSSDRRFHHQTHNYSDSAYYFITTDLGAGKRIQSVASSTDAITDAVNTYDDFDVHELDLLNILKSGRRWYGETVDLIRNTLNFNVTVPNRNTNDSVYIYVIAAGRSQGTGVNNYFTVSVNGAQRCMITNGPASTQYYLEYARENPASGLFVSSDPNISISMVFSSPDNTAVGWLNYFELNVRKHLNFSGAGSQMEFRDSRTAAAGKVSEFTIANTPSGAFVWDVTDPGNVLSQQVTPGGNSLTFTRHTDTLRTFVVSNGSTFSAPVFSERIQNQNLHAMGMNELIIISNPAFLHAADRLAQFHRDHDQMTVAVVPLNQIFNEFSSGAQDASGIRDFIKMFYDKAASPAQAPKYILNMGDASYDNKNRIQNNTNYITTYESEESLNLSKSYASDDFYGLLDDNEGEWRENDNDLLDIAIGRLPVKSMAEADGVVNKIIGYASPDAITADTMHCTTQSASAFGDWRNLMLFVADDEDSNIHLQQAQYLADSLTWGRQPTYNVDKIYLDAYKQQSTPGGERYPDVQSAISSRVQRGALLVTYVGHGGELGWAQERVLEVNDINNWTNLNSLPAFLTATCEFSRVDDPARTSAGEYVLLNPNGGGIALFTTTRLAYSNTNNDLAIRFFKNLYLKINGAMPRMGDIFEKTKVESNNLYLRNFFLLGDPALRLNYPKNKVVTSSINGVAVSATPDTLSALGKVTITGFVADTAGNKLTSFNGILYPTVFDKVSAYNTLANDNGPGGSAQTSFKLQKNILYKGKVTVTNGDFSFTFVLPKDISFQYGPGKLSYYAQNGTDDAAGYYDNIIIGGVNTSAGSDPKGPDISLYMNDENFVFGGTTDASPVLLALIKDTSGVNTVGNGIGHDITAKLDNDNARLFVLNDYFEYDQNSYQQGRVQYPMNTLSDGRHSVNFKVWDVYNNSSEASIEFVVASSSELALNHVLNYPNPFTTHTTFFFEHNKPCSEMDVQVQVFTVSGKLIKTIQKKIFTEGFRSEDVEWDGLDDYGDKIGRGAYIYKLQIRTPEGLHADKFEKLVILR